MKFKISVALCTYNGSRYISEQLSSILAQTRMPDEVIICDDNSTDDTGSIVESTLKYTKIYWKLVVNETNLGVAKNFEKAISLCTGDIIFTSDQDDYWVANKVEIMEQAFLKKQEAVLVFTNAHLVDNKLVSLGNDLWSVVKFNEHLSCTDAGLFALLLKENFVTGATMAFRNTLAGRILPIDKNWIHDYWIAIIAVLSGRIVALPEKLVLYRQHSTNVIGASKLTLLSQIRKYLSNFKNLESIREIKLNRLSALLNHVRVYCKNSKEDIIRLEACHEFWQRKMQLAKVGKFTGVRSIFKDLLLGNYHKYYTGYRGALRDVIIIFFKT